MDRVETTPARQLLPTFIQPIIGFVVRWWNTLINIGVYEGLSNFDIKRIRLLNGICLIPVVVFAGHVVYYTDPEHEVVFWESLQGMIFLSVPVVLNHYRKYDAAAYFFVIYSSLLYSFFAVSHGPIDGAEYILIPASVCSMLFFRRFVIVALLFLLNLIAFFIVQYAYTVVKPFLFMPAGENLYYSNLFIVFVALFLVVNYFKAENTRQETQLEKRSEVIAAEKAKSDNLLLNILPRETAEELKETGGAQARYYANASVFFSDFKNFTTIAERLSPEKLVSVIDHYFSNFDRIVARHGVEKIKTIGDAYMCAAGLPKERASHAVDIVRAALDILEFMRKTNVTRQANNEPFFEARIGIHSGPVVAGIVGTTKFAYDIWGDAVNTAARMESGSEVGCVNISGATYALIKDHFRCTPRGKLLVKGKGEVDMYFVDGPIENTN